MNKSIIAAFDAAADFEAALQRCCKVELRITGEGPFRAQLACIELPRLCLMRGKEWSPRIAIVTADPACFLVMLPMRSRAAQSGEMTTLSGGERLQVRAEGPSQWDAIALSTKELMRLGRAVIGPAFELPSGVVQWRPGRTSLRALRELFDGALRMTGSDPALPTGPEAARGLEQEVMRVIITCLTPREQPAAPPTKRRKSNTILS